MILTARINNEDEFRLVRFDSQSFVLNRELYIQGTDFGAVKEACQNIQTLDIYSDETLISSYKNYDTYDKIAYLGTDYVPGEDKFVDVIMVSLTKADLIEQVKRLDQQLNPTIDFDSMSLEQYKDYKIKEIQSAVQADIFAGKEVTLSDGSKEFFEFTLEDQSNIANLYMTVISSNGKITALPFHSHGNYCREYSIADIVLLYIEMQKCITEKTTIANFTIQKAREALTKEAVDEVYYGMEFDAATADQINAILTSTLATINVMLRELGFTTDEEPSDEPSEEPVVPDETGEEE